MRYCECGNVLDDDTDELCAECWAETEAEEEIYQPLDFNREVDPEEVLEDWEWS